MNPPIESTATTLALTAMLLVALTSTYAATFQAICTRASKRTTAIAIVSWTAFAMTLFSTAQH